MKGVKDSRLSSTPGDPRSSGADLAFPIVSRDLRTCNATVISQGQGAIASTRDMSTRDTSTRAHQHSSVQIQNPYIVLSTAKFISSSVVCIIVRATSEALLL